MDFPEHEEDEEEVWIPLSKEERGSTLEDESREIPRVAYLASKPGDETGREPNHAASGADNTFQGKKPHQKPHEKQQQKQQQQKQQQQRQRRTSYRGQDSGSSSNSARLKSVQRKLEDRISIQNHLVNNPIGYFWQRCLINALRQIWSLELRVRLGIALLVCGLLARAFLWSTWYLLYPRFAVLSFLLVASLLYLDPFDVQDQIRATWDLISALVSAHRSTSQQKQQLMVKGIDAHQLRRLSFVLFMIPTALEIRTFSFLSRINAELTIANAASANGEGWSMSSASYYFYDIGFTLCILATTMFLLKVRGMKPCDVSYRGLLMLYGFSLLITIASYHNEKNDTRRIPLLAAPFLTASATLLLMYQDDGTEWLSRIVRQTFRLSLRDVLSSISERVTEDEMLQLAILRWICDFWASNPESATKPQRTEKPDTSSSKPAGGPSSHSNSSASTEEPPLYSTNAGKAPTNPKESMPFEPHDIRWEELQPMLNIEIDHMEIEIDALQSNGSNSSNAGSNVINDNQKQPESQSTEMPPMPNPNTSNHPKESDTNHVEPLMALKSMLLSFDVDDRAQPAVLAYKRAVESFPPKKKTAVAVSVMRRCPALLTFSFHVFSVSDFNSFFISSLILSPFMIVEYYRIIGWMETCQRNAPIMNNERNEAQSEDDWRIPQRLKTLDTMTILLSGDVHNPFRPPSLLVVWHNIMSSVAALQVGLSTARCAETTAVAIEFAGNAMSLVKFGFEISQNGLLHGAAVLFKEALAIQASGRNIADRSFPDDGSAEYTSAAIRAVHSGQKVVKNIHTLAEDQHVLDVAQPVLQFLGVLVGHKWLWGKEDDNRDDDSEPRDGSPELAHGEDGKINANKDANESNSVSNSAQTNEGNDMQTPKPASATKEASSETFNDFNSPQNENNFASTSAQTNEDDDMQTPKPAFATREASSESLNDLNSTQNEKNCASTSAQTNEDNDMQTPKSAPATIEASSETLNDLNSTQNDLLSKSTTPEEELSQVMEMVATLYESGLIDEDEKNDFFQKLVELRTEELFDPSTLLGMKRTLRIILENGIKTSTLEKLASSDSGESHTNNKSDEKCANQTDDVVSRARTIETTKSELPSSSSVPLSQTEENDGGDSKEQSNHNDNLIALGVAALGIVASGVVLTMGINAKQSEERQGSCSSDENFNNTNGKSEERKSSSTVEIVELVDDDGEENWIPINQ